MMTRFRLTSRVIPFVVGIALAALLFIFFGFDLAHHWAPYSPDKSPFDSGTLVPVLISLAVIVAAAGPRLVREVRSTSWPCAPAAIETSSIQSFSRKHRRFYVLTVGYWYLVNGERYGGVWTQRFNRKSDAEGALSGLEALSGVARYNPVDPSESVLNV